MGDLSQTQPLPKEEQPAAVARLIVRITAAFTGRGPSKARAEFGTDVITVVLQDTLTKGERSLVEDGKADLVISMRRSFQQTMRSSMIEGITEITGRTVIAFLSDHHLDPDIAVETFVLEPIAPERPEGAADD